MPQVFVSVMSQNGLRCLVNGKKPFGIDPFNPPYFKPVEYNKTTLKKYPDANHMPPIRDDVYELQLLQKDTKKLLKKMNNNSQNGFEVIKRNAQHLKHFDNPDTVTVSMVKKIDKHPNQYFFLGMRAGSGNGHAMGFGQDKNGTYHFIDANSGWFTFKDKDAFQKWLSFYFQQIGYTNHFNSYAIDSYELIKKNSLKQMANSITSFFADVTHGFIFSLADLFYSVNNKTKTECSFEENDVVAANTTEVQENTFDNLSSNSKDDSYNSKKTQHDTSYPKLFDLLDVSRARRVKSASMRAEENEENNEFPRKVPREKVTSVINEVPSGRSYPSI